MDFNNFKEFPLVFKKPQHKSTRKINKANGRFMNKAGHLNMQLSKVPSYKYVCYTKDFANTLVSIRWRWVTVIVVLTNAFVYATFGGLWMFDAWLSGDFNVTKAANFCIQHSRTYTGYLLLSIETITTTGYGYLYPSEHCRLAVAILTLSTIVTIMLDGAFFSVVFLKVCKPLKKEAITLFSKKAVICLRNGRLCLVLRIYDHLNKHVITPKLSVYFIDRAEKGNDGLDVNLIELDIKDAGLFIWPTDVVHEINHFSPLWEWTAADFMNQKLEIIVILSGSSLVTSQCSISQTSYLNNEILWGYRFKSCIEFDEKRRQYAINQKNMSRIAPCDTPLCSASKLKEIKHEVHVKMTKPTTNKL